MQCKRGEKKEIQREMTRETSFALFGQMKIFYSCIRNIEKKSVFRWKMVTDKSLDA